MERFRVAVTVLLLTSFIELSVCNKYCPYFDSFNRLHHRWCKTECCGNIHQSHCCLEKEVGQIVFGSIGGLVLLVGIVIGTIFCCRRFNIYPRRRIGDETDSLIPQNRDRSHPPAARKPYGSTASAVASSVHVTITPPSPSEKPYRIISRPEPTFGSFQQQSATNVVVSEMGNSQPPPRRTTEVDIVVEPSGDVDVIIESESDRTIIEPVFQPNVEIITYPDDPCPTTDIDVVVNEDGDVDVIVEETAELSLYPEDVDVIVSPGGDVDVIVETQSYSSSSSSSSEDEDEDVDIILNPSGGVDVIIEPVSTIDTYPSEDVDIIVSPSGNVDVIVEPEIDFSTGDVDVVVTPGGDIDVIVEPEIDIGPYSTENVDVMVNPSGDVDVVVNPYGETNFAIGPTPAPYPDAGPYYQQPAGAYITSYPDTNPYPTSDVGPYGGDPAVAYTPYAGDYVEESGGYGGEVVVSDYSDDEY